MPAYQHCYTCDDYRRKRGHVIARPLADKAIREGRDVVSVVDEFMSAAHERHMKAGKALYRGGPTRVLNPLLGRIAAVMSMTAAHADDEQHDTKEDDR